MGWQHTQDVRDLPVRMPPQACSGREARAGALTLLLKYGCSEYLPSVPHPGRHLTLVASCLTDRPPPRR